MARAAASTCFVVSVYIQSSKLSVCKHLVFLAATRPVQSLQSSHVFYGVDLATPESTTPAQSCQPHPQNVVQVTPASVGPPPRKCKSVKLHTPSGFTLHPLFCNPILHNCVTLWFTEAYLRWRR